MPGVSDVASVKDATHLLYCTRVIGHEIRHYHLRCVLLGETKSGKCKVLVFGGGLDQDTDKWQVLYVDEWRLTAVNTQ